MKEYQLGLYEKALPPHLGWTEKLLCAREAGFDYVELSIDESDERLERLDWSGGERAHLLGLMRETGVPLSSMCLSAHRKYPLGSHDAAIRKRGMEIMEKAVLLSEDLGVRIIQLAGYDVYYEDGDEDTRKYFEDNLFRVAELAARGGVLLGFETMETDFMNTVKKAMRYVSLVDSPYLNVYPDIGNLTNAAKASGSDVLVDLESGRGRLVAMHLKETIPGVFREMPFGSGHVDFVAGINKAWSLGIRRYVTEMWYTGSDGWKQDIAAAHQMMTAFLDRMK